MNEFQKLLTYTLRKPAWQKEKINVIVLFIRINSNDYHYKQTRVYNMYTILCYVNLNVLVLR